MTDTPFKAPDSDIDANIEPPERYESVLGKIFAFFGLLLFLALPIGLLVTAYDIWQLFELIALQGSGDPEIMKAGLSQALVSTVLGLTIFAFNIVFFCIAVAVFKYRRRWLYRLCWISAVMSLVFVPIGTLCGVITIRILLKSKADFFV